MSSIARHPSKPFEGPNRRRSCSDSAIQVECSFCHYPLPNWALPRSDYDVASCSSDDDHERIELNDRKGYRRARRNKLKVRRRWEQRIGLDWYEVPRFCKELTEHVRSTKVGPLDADATDEAEGFLSALTAPYEPPPSLAKYSPFPPSHESNQHRQESHGIVCPPGLCSCAAEQDIDNDLSSEDDEPIPHLDGGDQMNHDLYTPSGRWEEVRHRPIEGWETLMRMKGVLTAGNYVGPAQVAVGSYSPFISYVEERCNCGESYHIY